MYNIIFKYPQWDDIIKGMPGLRQKTVKGFHDRNAIETFSFSVIPLFFFLQMLLARILEPEDFGLPLALVLVFNFIGIGLMDTEL